MRWGFGRGEIKWSRRWAIEILIIVFGNVNKWIDTFSVSENGQHGSKVDYKSQEKLSHRSGMEVGF